MNIAKQKSALRKIFKEKRLELSTAEVKKKSEEICRNFIQNLAPLLPLTPQKIFSLYLAANNEVSCESLAQHFEKNHIKFSYPKITAPEQPLQFIEFEKNQEFVASNMYKHILEPAAGKKILPDFVILPLLAFDSDLSRLGMGGGFFDRTISFLKSQKSEIITIGLAFDFQRAHKKLSIENTDQKLDFIVTEKSIFAAS
jgi:5-formyltetrahydrofolate cyclo-ligase